MNSSTPTGRASLLPCLTYDVLFGLCSASAVFLIPADFPGTGLNPEGYAAFLYFYTLWLYPADKLEAQKALQVAPSNFRIPTVDRGPANPLLGRNCFRECA